MVFLVDQNGLIYNDPFGETNFGNYQITETNVTSITLSDWELIKNKNNDDISFKINNGQTLIVRSFLDSYLPNVFFLLNFSNAF